MLRPSVAFSQSQGDAMPLVNASSARRVILRMTRGERHRGFADQSTPANHSWSSCVTLRCLGGCARYRALWAPAECALRRPWRRTEGVPCGTDVMMSTYACAILSSTPSSDRQLTDHRADAENVPRGGVVNARRPGHRPGRSVAKSIDDAEHGASIKNAMVRRLDLALQP
jgi:hypothetical protein